MAVLFRSSRFHRGNRSNRYSNANKCGATAISPAAESHAPVLKSLIGVLLVLQPNTSMSDGEVDDPIEQQKKGAVFMGVWNCNGTDSSMVVQAALIDKAGNKSEPLEYSVVCY